MLGLEVHPTLHHPLLHIMKSREENISYSGPRALPIEILSKIFHHCTDLDGSLTPVNTIDVPLLLTKICSGWRNVAISTQSLWSRLFLNIQPNATHQTALVSTWLARSGAYPLQIYIIWETPPFYPSHTVLDVLVQHSHHWRNMFFFIPFPAYQSLASIRGNLPMLAELSLGTHDDIVVEPVSDAFEIAPLLQSVECVNLHPDAFKLPWASLTKIPIMAVTVEDSIDILHRATNLENGSFICSSETNLLAKPINPLRHNNMRELAILTTPGDEGVDTHILFRFLTLPRLRLLRICNVQWSFGSCIAPFLSRIDSLESLYLRRNALSEQDLFQILRLVPFLKHLTVRSSSLTYAVTHDLLDRLIWRPTETPLIPRLETLEFTIHSAIGASFVQLLESRWNVENIVDDAPRVSRLIKAHAITNEEFGEDILQRLETLAAAGMNIIIERLDEGLSNDRV